MSDQDAEAAPPDVDPDGEKSIVPGQRPGPTELTPIDLDAADALARTKVDGNGETDTA